MDRQLTLNGRSLQQPNGQLLNVDFTATAPPIQDAVGKGGDYYVDSFPANKENSFLADGAKAGYSKDRQPGRSILRKDGSDLQALQSKFSSLQGEVLNFNAQKPARRESLIGRGGIPAPLQPPLQQSASQAGAPMLRPTDAAAASWRPAQSAAQSIQPHQQETTTLCHDAGGCQGDDAGLGGLISKERFIKLPTGGLATMKAVKAAQEVFEPVFQESCIEGLTKRLQRTREGATEKSRIQDLIELMKLLRTLLKDMGNRATGYIEKCATIERECAQQVENITLASKTSLRQVEAELASTRSSLAAVERDFRNEKAKLGLDLDTQMAEVSRLLRDLDRLTEERDRARENAVRTEKERQQLDFELKELRKAASQQQREIVVSQSEAVRLLTEEKNTIEKELESLRDEGKKLSSRMVGMHECMQALEHEGKQLRYSVSSLQKSLASKDTLVAYHQEQIAKAHKELSQTREQLHKSSEDNQRLQQEIGRSNEERVTLGAFVEEQGVELDQMRNRAMALESTMTQEMAAWEEQRMELQASVSALSNQRSSLAREVAEVTMALRTVTEQKEAVESSAARLVIEKATLIREGSNLQNQIEFAEARAAHVEQDAVALRKQIESMQAELEANRQLLGEKGTRLDQLEGEFAALKEVLGESVSVEGESGTQIVTKLLTKIAALQHAAVEAESVRRRLHNDLVDMRGNIRVYCRVKPHATPATRLGSDGSSIAVGVEGREHNFSFDRVFGPNITQEQVFGAVSELVQSSLDGFHVCVFSYGQTGAGKTHTMQGGREQADRGIIPRALEKILATAKKLEEEAEWSYKMEASFIEVYNETLRDLLSSGAVIPDNKNQAIKHDGNGGHTVVLGAEVVKVVDMETAAVLLRQAGKARAVAATAMNATSSRSHCVFMLNITGVHASTGTRLQGSLCLVDLAGSERLVRSQAEGAAIKEACAINSSLSSLGDVFTALSLKNAHVPYRNNKLTYLLQPCLGGNGKTLMFVNINPEPASAGESLCSLRFAAKVNGCETGAKGGARRNVQTLGGGSGEAEPNGSSDPAGSSRFSLGIPKLPGGVPDTLSAAAAKRMSLVPQRLGADGGAGRTKAAPGVRPGTTHLGTSVGVKRPAAAMPDVAAKRNKPQ